MYIYFTFQHHPIEEVEEKEEDKVEEKKELENENKEEMWEVNEGKWAVMEPTQGQEKEQEEMENEDEKEGQKKDARKQRGWSTVESGNQIDKKEHQNNGIPTVMITAPTDQTCKLADSGPAESVFRSSTGM